MNIILTIILAVFFFILGCLLMMLGTTLKENKDLKKEVEILRGQVAYHQDYVDELVKEFKKPKHEI
jgi:cell division protein FtsB